MPSGKQSRRTRHTHVPSPPGARRRASPKVLVAGAGVVAAAVVAIVLAITLGGGGGSPSTPPSKLPDAAFVQSLLAGIPQHGNTLGSTKAPVTLIEYLDLQCPYCDEFERQVFPDLVKRYVRPGKVRMEVRPLAFIGPDSVTGRKALLAAGDQNKLFQFMELLYENQGTENTGWLDDSMIKDAAVSIPGLDLQKLLTDRNSSAVATQAKTFDSEANAAKVNSTPTVLVGATGGTPRVVSLSSPTDEAAVVAAISRA
jgi:protein-disulfide isomerase